MSLLHASLPSCAKSGSQKASDCVLPISIWHDDRMVFGAKVALSALANCGAAPPNVRSNTKRADKGHGFDRWMIANEVDGVGSAVKDVENTGWQPCFCG